MALPLTIYWSWDENFQQEKGIVTHMLYIMSIRTHGMKRQYYSHSVYHVMRQLCNKRHPVTHFLRGVSQRYLAGKKWHRSLAVHHIDQNIMIWQEKGRVTHSLCHITGWDVTNLLVRQYYPPTAWMRLGFIDLICISVTLTHCNIVEIIPLVIMIV